MTTPQDSVKVNTSCHDADFVSPRHSLDRFDFVKNNLREESQTASMQS
jgi:hypothetical protein